MIVILERAEFSADRQYVDVTVQLPDHRPGWLVELHAKGPTSPTTPWQPCSADSDGNVRVRFYPFLKPGEYTLLARVLPPDVAVPVPKQARDALDLIEIGRVTVPVLDQALASEWLRHDGTDLCQVASRSMLPLCVDPHGAPCFWPLQGASRRRVAVLSVPKAGTYLVSRLLENLGMVSCRVHIGRALVGDYRISKQMPPPAQRYLDVAFSCRLVLPGQSLASHMRRDLATETTLYDYSKVFVFRELRAALVSAFRTGLRRSRHQPEKSEADGSTASRGFSDSAQGLIDWLERGDLARMRRQYRSVAGWYDHPDICRVAFEEIMGDFGPQRRLAVVAAVAAQCGVDIDDAQAQKLLEDTVGADTQTFSGERSNLADYWSPEAEQLFSEAGLQRLNVALGYQNRPLGAGPPPRVKSPGRSVSSPASVLPESGLDVQMASPMR